MRVWSAVVAFMLAGAICAQMPNLGGVVRKVMPTTAPQDQSVPTIPPLPPDRAFDFDADESTRDGDQVFLKGNVRIKFRDFTATCDEAEGNVKTQIFLLKGHVLVLGEGLNYEGKQVRVNFKEKTAEFISARSTIKPELVKSGLQEPIYIRGDSGTGSERRYTLSRGALTTCALPDPHYDISARSIEVMTGDRMILRDARLTVLGNTLLRLPYLSIPLDYNAPRYIPETGQSRDEGYFIKTRFGIGLPGDDLLDARIDVMSKLGVGLGTDFDYQDRSMKGALKLYNLIGPQPSTTAGLLHNQRLGNGFLSVNADYANRNYLTAPNNTLVNLRTLYQFQLLGGQTRIAFNRSTNESSSFQTKSQSVQVGDTRSWRGGLRTALDFNLSSYDSRSGFFNQSREVLEVNARASQRFSSVDADLAYQRTIPISEIVNFFSATDQTPLLTLRTDTRRLLGKSSPGRGFNLLTELSVGELIDAVRRRPVGRTTMEFILPQQSLGSGKTTLNIAGRFKQGFYSDNTAQFIFGADSNYSYNFGKDSSLNLRYNYLRPQGYTPLSVDRTGRSDLFGGDVSFRLARTFLVAAQSGYDLLAKDRNLGSSWQSVGTRMEWTPSSNFSLRTSATYDTFSQLWNSIRVDSVVKKGSTKFYLGARYDGQRSTWGAVNLIGEGLRWGRLTTSFLLSYNGYTSRFESRQFSFMYDLHCAEALLEIIDNQTGFRNGTSVAFYIRLKALPFATPFGRGTRGQGYGTGTGVNF